MPPAEEQNAIFDPSAENSKNAYVSSIEQYNEWYKQSLDSPEIFWGNIAKQFHWETDWDPKNFFSYNFDLTKGNIFTKWLDGASTNISYNLLDRNVKNGLADTVAFYW